MKEDIKILEEYIHDSMRDYIYSKDVIQAIENLIARYKELEKENLEIRDWKYVIDSYEDLDRLKELDVIKIKGKEYLAKSKVKEKLLEPIQAEAEKAYKNFMNKKKEENFEIDGALLQELGAIEGMIIELLEES